MIISYLNTDLVLVCPQDLKPLISAFGELGLPAICGEIEPHYGNFKGDDGNWHASFETNEPYDDPNANLLALLSAVESLSGQNKKIWDSCSIKLFDIGYDCGKEPWAFNNVIATETLRRMAENNISLRITLYPDPGEE